MTMIALSDITLSKTNPRRRRDEKADAEMTESVRRLGVLQPVLVRPVTTNGKPFELVAGSRRYAAAKAAGLTEIPAIEKALTDVEVIEVQIVENLQRADVHPLEEAEAYRDLHEKHGYDVEQLAAKVGKSKAYIYARMKLVALQGKARDAFDAGKFDASIALLIARIPHADLQAKAAAEILGENLPFREAARVIARDYMLRLADAPFDPKDSGLVVAAGPCAACPKRTGNQAELFADVQGADVCTDPKCYQLKVAASGAMRLRQAREAGKYVLEGKAAERLFDKHSNLLVWGSAYVDLDEPTRSQVPGLDYTEKKLRVVLKKALAEPGAPVVAVLDYIGRAHELVAVKDLPELAKAAGIRVTKAKPENDSYQRHMREAQRKAKVAKARGRAMVAALLAKAKAAPLEKLWPIIEAYVYRRSMNDAEVEVLKARGIERQKVKKRWGMALEDGAEAIHRWLGTQPAKERPAIAREVALQVMLTNDAPVAHVDSETGPVLTAAGKALGVNLKAVSDKARAGALEALKKKPKKAAAKGKAGRKAKPSRPEPEPDVADEDGEEGADE